MECKKCHCLVDCPSDLEPTDFCNPCAQELLVKVIEFAKHLLGMKSHITGQECVDIAMFLRE